MRCSFSHSVLACLLLNVLLLTSVIIVISLVRRQRNSSQDPSFAGAQSSSSSGSGGGGQLVPEEEGTSAPQSAPPTHTVIGPRMKAISKSQQLKKDQYGGFIVTNDDVTLDCQGYNIVANVSQGDLTALLVTDGRNRIKVQNCNILCWTNSTYPYSPNGIHIIASSNVAFANVTVTGCRNGLDVDDNSRILITETFEARGNDVFGMVFTNNVAVTLNNSVVTIDGEGDGLAGIQVSVGSTLLMNATNDRSDSNIEIMNHRTFGMSCSYGAHCYFLGGGGGGDGATSTSAIIDTHDNGSHGVILLTKSAIELERNAQLFSNDNGGHGIFMEDSTINMFTHSSDDDDDDDGPIVDLSNNQESGLLMRKLSVFDTNDYAKVTILNNGGVGIDADDSNLRIGHATSMDVEENGLHGITMISKSVLAMERKARLFVNNNGGHGVLMEDSNVNMLSQSADDDYDGPVMDLSSNQDSGLLMRKLSVFDTNDYASVMIQNNGGVGIDVDNSHLRIGNATNIDNQNNGLHGMTLISKSVLELELTARLFVNNNGGHGVFMEDSSVNMLSQSPDYDGPVMDLSSNQETGILMRKLSVFDTNDYASVRIQNNGGVGIDVDNSNLRIGNATVDNRNNGLHGMTLISKSVLELEPNARLFVNNNGGHGIFMEDSSVNMLTQPPDDGPTMDLLSNQETGITMRKLSVFDTNSYARVTIQNNRAAGLDADDSTLRIGSNTIVSDNDALDRDVADLILSFGSRAKFEQQAIVGSIECDFSALVQPSNACRRFG